MKKLIPPPVLDPIIPKPNQDIFDPPVSSVQPPLPEPSIPNEVPYIPPIPEPFVPPSVPDPVELPPPYEETPPPYEPPPPYEDLEDIFIDDEIDDQPKISLVPVDKTDGDIVAMPSDDEIEIKKSLNDTDIQVISRPTCDTYATTKTKRDRRLKKIRGHLYNIKSESILLKKTAQQIKKKKKCKSKKKTSVK